MVVYITTADVEEARKIGKTLVKERLAACANIVEKIESLFWWEGDIDNDEESVLLLKSKEDKFRELEKRVRELHSYDIPDITAFPIIKGSRDYLDWIGEEVKD